MMMKFFDRTVGAMLSFALVLTLLMVGVPAEAAGGLTRTNMFSGPYAGQMVVKYDHQVLATESQLATAGIDIFDMRAVAEYLGQQAPDLYTGGKHYQAQRHVAANNTAAQAFANGLSGNPNFANVTVVGNEVDYDRVNTSEHSSW